MTIKQQDLNHSSRRDRYLEELAEHTQDAGGDEQLGSTDELIATFNMYVHDARKQKKVFAAKVALGTFLFILLCNFAGAILPEVIAGPIVSVGRVMLLPMVVIVYFPLMQLGIIPVEGADSTSVNVFIFWSLAMLGMVLNSLFWAGVVTLFRYPPQRFSRVK